KHLRDARRGACDTAEAECRRDQRDDEERNSPTEHGLSPSLWTLSLCAGLTPAAGTWFPALERAVRDPAHRGRIRRARPDCARGGNWRETGRVLSPDPVGFSGRDGAVHIHDRRSTWHRTRSARRSKTPQAP